jgi:hypothetical protein
VVNGDGKEYGVVPNQERVLFPKMPYRKGLQACGRTLYDPQPQSRSDGSGNSSRTGSTAFNLKLGKVRKGFAFSYEEGLCD